MYSYVDISGSVMSLKRSTLLSLVLDQVYYVLQFVDHGLVLFPVYACFSGSFSVCVRLCILL